MGACKHVPRKLTFFSVYYSGSAAGPPWRVSYPWLQSDLKGKKGSKLPGDSTSAFSAGARELVPGEGGRRRVSAGGTRAAGGLSQRRHALGGFGGRGPLSVRCCTDPQSPGLELVELRGATVIQTVNKICG